MFGIGYDMSSSNPPFISLLMCFLTILVLIIFIATINHGILVICLTRWKIAAQSLNLRLNARHRQLWVLPLLAVIDHLILTFLLALTLWTALI